MPDHGEFNDLLRATPFGELDEEHFAGVARLFVRRRVSKGAVVFLEGDEGERFFVVAEGLLKAFRHTPAARDVTVFTLNPGEFFGFLPLLDGGPFPVSVAALASSTLLVLHRPDFVRFTQGEPRFCLALLAHLASRFRGCLDQVEMLGRQGAVARAAHAMLSLAPSGSPSGGALEVALPFSQTEFAQLLHITPENLSRALAAMRRRGLVERVRPRLYRVPSVSLLRAAADGDA